MRDFRSLKVWEKSHFLALEVYRHSQDFPADERFGLTAQIRRAATSIPANIAEGCGRSGNRELARYLGIAMGSASELEYHLILARDLELMMDESYLELSRRTREVKRMLTGLMSKLTADS